MSKNLKSKSVTLSFTITRETDRTTGEQSYQLLTEGKDGRAYHRAVVPTWIIDGQEPKPDAHDAVDMAQRDLWAAVMGANL